MSLTEDFPTWSKKYELLPGHDIMVGGTTLHRIRAIKDFGDVKAGQLGGFVASEHNLSQLGNCWIADDAQVYDQATVSDDAQVLGLASVRDRARIGDKASVLGNAQVFEDGWVFKSGVVFDNAMIYGSGQVRDDGMVSGNAHVFDRARVLAGGNVSGNARIGGRTVVGGEQTVSRFLSTEPKQGPTSGGKGGPRTPKGPRP